LTVTKPWSSNATKSMVLYLVCSHRRKVVGPANKHLVQIKSLKSENKKLSKQLHEACVSEAGIQALEKDQANEETKREGIERRLHKARAHNDTVESKLPAANTSISQGAHSLLQEGVAAVLVSIEAVNERNRAFVGDLNKAITARDERILAMDKKYRVFVDDLNKAVTARDDRISDMDTQYGALLGDLNEAIVARDERILALGEVVALVDDLNEAIAARDERISALEEIGALATDLHEAITARDECILALEEIGPVVRDLNKAITARDERILALEGLVHRKADDISKLRDFILKHRQALLLG